jgi:hypothetical protein
MRLNPLAKPAAPPGRRRPNTGQAAPAAPHAYSSQRAGPASPPPAKRTGRGRFKRLAAKLLYLLILVIMIDMLSLSTNAKVLPLDSQNQTLLRNNKIYQTTADQLLGDSVWNHSKLTVNTARLKQQMLAQFPELDSVNVTLPLFSHSPVVYIVPAKPVLVLASSDNGALVIAADGKAILRTDAGDPVIAQLHLPKVEDQSGFNIQANRQVLPVSQIVFIQNILAQLQAKGYGISNLTLPPASSELDVRLAGQTYIIKFNLQSNSPREQAGTFIAAVNSLKRQNITPGKYVDVRVPGRAYYQ